MYRASFRAQRELFENEMPSKAPIFGKLAHCVSYCFDTRPGPFH